MITKAQLTTRIQVITSVLSSPTISAPSTSAENESTVFHLQKAALHLASAPKDLRVHTSTCRSIRNKMDEMRLLQSVGRFDIIGMTETHLDPSVSQNEVYIEGMKLFRQDR